jgi:hypothetical protein
MWAAFRASITSSKALEDPDRPDHEDLTDWYGASFHPNALDEAKIRKRLVRLGARKKRKTA